MLNRGKKQPIKVGYFGNFQRIPKINSRQVDENSLNLVTLLAPHLEKCSIRFS
jgi:hypothetical protein